MAITRSQSSSRPTHQSGAAGGQQGRPVPRKSQTGKTKMKRKTPKSSGKSNQTSGLQTKSTNAIESIKSLIGDLVKGDVFLQYLWRIWLICYRAGYSMLTIFIPILAVLYLVKTNFSDIRYSRALCELRPIFLHKSNDRTSDVKYIVERLDNLSSTYIPKEVHVIIIGGPGSGKSELARQFGQHLCDDGTWLNWFDTYLGNVLNLSVLRPPVDVVTLNADSVADLQHSIEDAIGKLEGKDESEIAHSKDTGEEEVLANFLRLKQAFKRRSSRPVLIFDNVKRAMYKVLFKSQRYGKFLLSPGNIKYGEIKVVVTTQYQPILPLLHTYYINLSDGMPLNESVRLLNAITGIHDDDKNASYLAKELGCMPFSLANAALYIQSDRSNKENRLSYYHYLKELKLDVEKYRNNIEFFWNMAKDEGLPYNITMLTTSIKTIEQLVGTNNGNLYKDLACFVGYCDSQTISAKLFWEYIRMNTALQNYTKYSVMLLVPRSSVYELQTQAGHTFIFTHQVTREASRIVCKQKGLNHNDSIQGHHFVEDSFARILEVISKVLDEKPQAHFNQMTEYRLVDVLMSLASHTFWLKLEYSKIITKKFCWKILKYMAEPYLYWSNKHNSTTAMPKVACLINMMKESFSEGKPEFGAFFSVLYIYYYTGNQDCNDLEEVVKPVEDFAASSFENGDKTSVVNITLLLNMIGTVYRDVCQNISKAQNLHELALNISRTFTSSSDIAVSLNLLGIIYSYRKQLDIAQQHHEQAVKLARQIYSTKHSHLGVFVFNLAVVYNGQGELNKSKIMYQEALDITKEAYGARDQRVASVLNASAINYYSLGEYDDSIHALLEALNIHEVIHGDIHPNFGETLHFIGFTYHAKGDLQQSLETLERSLKIQEKYYGPVHYHVGKVLHDLSNTQREIHRLEDALSNGKRSLEIFQRSFGKRDSLVGNSLNGIGLIYNELGDPGMAKIKHEEALVIFEELNNQGSQVVALSETLKHLANLSRKLKDTKKAQDYIRRALSVLRTVYEEDHPRIKEFNKLLEDVQSKEHN